MRRAANIPTEVPRLPAGDPLAPGKIVGAARLHFMSHGFRGVSMDDLAAELGMSKKTIYAHFPSKQALLEAVIADKFRSADTDFARVTDTSTSDFQAALGELLVCVRRHSEELQPAFLRDMAREVPALFQKVQARRRALIQRYFGKLLLEGRKKGMIRKDIPVELAIEILSGAADAVVNPLRLTELDLPAKTALTAILQIFLEGVVTEKGRVKK